MRPLSEDYDKIRATLHPGTDKNKSFFISFSDLMVILLAFFVMLFSISKINTGQYHKLKSELTGSSAGTLVELAKALTRKSESIKGVSISYDEDGVRVNIESATLFDVASASLKTEALSPLIPILNDIKITDYQIDVEGHTDDQAYYRKLEDTYDTNWSLSGRRASSMIHFLLEMGFKDDKLRVVGYADNKPKISTTRKEGMALENARAKNRRVSILVH